VEDVTHPTRVRKPNLDVKIKSTVAVEIDNALIEIMYLLFYKKECPHTK
jgi:hypothetical protein